MKKIYWLIPIVMILLFTALLMYVNNREIDPESMVLDTPLSQLYGGGYTDGLTLLDQNRALLDAVAEDFAQTGNVTATLPDSLRTETGDGVLRLILAESPRFVVWLTPSEAGTASLIQPDAFNVAHERTPLTGNWTYCADWLQELGREEILRDQLEKYLPQKQRALLAEDAIAQAGLLLRTHEGVTLPQSPSGNYVVEARLSLQDGGVLTAYLDAKTKIYLGLSAPNS